MGSKFRFHWVCSAKSREKWRRILTPNRIEKGTLPGEGGAQKFVFEKIFEGVRCAETPHIETEQFLQ